VFTASIHIQSNRCLDPNYDDTEDKYYYGCCVVTAANNITVAAPFTPAKKVDQQTTMLNLAQCEINRSNYIDIQMLVITYDVRHR